MAAAGAICGVMGAWRLAERVFMVNGGFPLCAISG